ncbi:hypothetical protein L6452_02082 [Arctium lappa]|uniref:Uncharacterized protein n=1 Tax=Arctium lappa TaxID=4217 RepID=A0ACB9FHV6_ARCLA|nr:hypothetical protein L6452_02082 [Arctium lappa]
MDAMLHEAMVSGGEATNKSRSGESGNLGLTTKANFTNYVSGPMHSNGVVYPDSVEKKTTTDRVTVVEPSQKQENRKSVFERLSRDQHNGKPSEGQASQGSGEVAASQNQVVDDVGSTSGVMKDEQQTVPAMDEYRVNEADVKLPCGENKKEDHGVENREKGGGSMDSTSSRPLFEAVLSSFKTRRIPLGEKQNSNRFAALSREDVNDKEGESCMVGQREDGNLFMGDDVPMVFIDYFKGIPGTVDTSVDPCSARSPSGWCNQDHLGLGSFVKSECFELSFRKDSKVREVLNAIDGSWPHSWIDRIPTLATIPVPILNSSVRDVILWMSSSHEPIIFSVREAWCSLSATSGIMNWYTVVWFKDCIPRHAFCIWLASRKRLPTQDRFISWKHDPSDMGI